MKVSGNRFDGFYLVRAIRNAQLRVELLQLGGAVMALVNQVIQSLITLAFLLKTKILLQILTHLASLNTYMTK